jgi:hypothetical protein
MTKNIIVAFAIGCVAVAGQAAAHHGSSSLGSVRFAQPVMAGGTMLQPGTYEVRLTGEHVKPLPGQSEDAGQHVEFVSNGQVVAREVATVIPVVTAQVVGTSGREQSSGVVQMLKGNEFLRVSFNKGNERFLIHLPGN